MHSLIFKRTDSPKRMENVKQKFKEFEKLEFPIDGQVDAPPVHHDLFPSAVVTADESYCQPCHLPSLSGHLPHSSTCSYGIQALLHNVHRGYATDGGDRTPDQIMSFTDERDEASQQHESEILREWKRKKEEELQKRKRESQAKLDHILEQATFERKKLYKERDAQIQVKKLLNREREAKYYAEVEAQQQQQTQGGNLWTAVAALIDLHGDGDIGNNGKSPIATMSTNTMKHVNSLSPKSIAEHQLATPKKQDSGKGRPQNYLLKATKKSTDLSRMREILLKLQHQSLVR